MPSSRLLGSFRPLGGAWFLAGGLLFTSPGLAATIPPPVDKSGDSWAHPTPDGALREMTTDRPDATESPFTVDAGRVQLEMDFFNHTRSEPAGVRVRQWSLAAFNLRLGINRDLEAGLFLAPWTRVTEEPGRGAKETSKGFGDVTLRVKYNFWGNDGGGSAGGIVGDLTLPTAAHGLGSGRVEGQVLLPVAFDLNGGFGLGAMTGVEFRSRTSGFGPVWVNSLSLGRDWTETLGSYFELTSSTGDGAHVATLDVGLTYKVSAHTQLDGGVCFGLSRGADDVVIFTGLAHRF